MSRAKQPNPRKEGMRLDRSVVLLAVMALAVAPAGALAAEAPLLSGYGGPGAGEQQVIGSTVVGEGHEASGSPGNGREGSSPAAGGSVSSSSSAAGGESAETTSKPKQEAISSSSKQAHGAKHQSGAAGAGGKGSGSGGSPGQSGGASSSSSTGKAASETGTPAATRALQLAADRSSTLGLSGGQLLAVVLVAFGLVSIALATWRLRAVQGRSDSVDTDFMRPPSS